MDVDLTQRMVRCLRCGQLMREAEKLATCIWLWSNGQSTQAVWIRYECDTPDCGNQLNVEAS